MEIVNTLRQHVESSTDINNLKLFLDILKTIEEHLRNQKDSNDIKVIQCINLEGLDAVGKTTLAKELTRLLGSSGECFPTLPSELYPYHVYFDQQNEIVRRKFYHLCTIAISHQLLMHTDNTVPILDRYWPTTIAYQLAHDRQLDLSSIENFLHWPTYLIQPSHIIYLYINENERRRRIVERSTQKTVTAEEIQLETDDDFRLRLDYIYRRIPNIHIIDASGTPSEIAETILALLNKNKSER